MIDEILEKSFNNEYLSSLEYERLLKIEDDNELKELLDTARTIRDKYSKTVLLTPSFSMKDKTEEELLSDLKKMEELNIPRINFVREYDEEEDVLNACKFVKANTNLKTVFNLSGEFSFESIEKLAEIGIDTICCNLGTVNTEVFKAKKTDDTLTQRIRLCQNIVKNGIGLSSGIVLGIGESIPDRLKHLRFLSNYRTLEEIPIINFNTYPNFPTDESQIYPIKEQLKLIAVTRIMYPKMTITIPTPTFNPKYYEDYLNAGANSIATIDSLKYEQYLKIIEIIRNCGLEI